MATGAIDANGIWQYGEDDSETTFSALLNKVASSTSTQVGTLKLPGRVIQHKSVDISYFSGTNTTYTALTGSTITITPRSASSIFVIVGYFPWVYCNAASTLNGAVGVNGTAGAETATYNVAAGGVNSLSTAQFYAPGSTATFTVNSYFKVTGGTYSISYPKLMIQEISQ